MVSIVLTAFLIATDAFFIGLSLGVKKCFKVKYLFVINTIIFTMCLITYSIVCLVKDYIDFNTSLIVGIVFILMGLFAAFSKKSEDKNTSTRLKNIFALGLVMSIDATMSTASLTMQSNTFLIPVLIGLTHLIYTFAGYRLGKFLKFSHRTSSIISGSCLVLVGVLNVVGI